MKIKSIVILFFCFLALCACENGTQEEEIKQLNKKVDTLFESISNEISELKSRVEALEKDNEKSKKEDALLMARIRDSEAKLTETQAQQQEKLSSLATQVNIFRQQLAEIAEIYQLLESIKTELSEKSSEDQDQTAQITELQEEVSTLLALALVKWSEVERRMADLSGRIQSRPVVVSCTCQADIIDGITIKGSGENETSATENADQICNKFFTLLKYSSPHQLVECSVEETSPEAS